MAGGAFAFAGAVAPAPAAAAAQAPNVPALPVSAPATPGIARGGGGRLIAPTPAPQVGFGNTDANRIAHARSLVTLEQRRATRDRVRLELAALRLAADEQGDPEWSDEGDSEDIEGSEERSEDDEEEEEEDKSAPQNKKRRLK